MNNVKKLLSVALCLVIAFQLGIAALGAGEGEYVPVVGIILDKTELSMVYGSTAKLTGAVVPSNASDTGIVWKSSNEALLKVDGSGNLTAAEDTAETPSGAQKVTVTAVSVFDNKITAKCVVTIDNKPVNKIIAALKEIFSLLKSALPTIIEFGSSSIKPFFEVLVNFFKDLFATISVA